MDLFFQRGDVGAAIAAGRRAVALNPADAELRAGLAEHLVAAGRFDEGRAEITQAIGLSPAPPAWYQFTLFVASLMGGDTASAEEVASRIDPAECAGAYLARALVANHAGALDQARREIALLLERRPEWRAGFVRELALQLQNREVQARFEAELLPLLPAGVTGRSG
jgi:tetratricopeptide (TPR) repeat protein